MVDLETVLDEENIAQAIEHLLIKKNACGDDGVWLHNLAEYWEWNKEKICKQIEKREYYPQLIHDRMIITGVGKHRIISQMSSVDRLLVRALHQVLQAPLETEFSRYSFAYQPCSNVLTCTLSYAGS